MPSTLVVQCVSNHDDQVAAKIIRGLAVLIRDPMVTRAVAERPVLEFAIGILNNLSSNRPAEETIQRFGLRRAAREDERSTIRFYRPAANRLFDAVAHSGQRHRLWAYLCVS